MDVIGANISNVNTIGFKGSRVTFRDVLYQTIGNAGRASEEPLRGGINPTQIGLGVMISSIDVLNTRAGPQTTDKPTDVYIDGEGYFGVYNPGDGQIYYTRVGDFNFDPAGNLVDGNGNFVMGARVSEPAALGEEPDWTIESENGMWVQGSRDPSESEAGMSFNDWRELAVGEDMESSVGLININFDNQLFTTGMIQQISIGPDGVITAYVTDPDSDEGARLMTLGRIALFKFPNNDGLNQVGNTYLLPTANSGYPAIVEAGTNGTGRTITARLEMSNVELAREFTDMIITQRGFQANSRIITVSDEMLQELVNLKR
jgi:flagellar hook protein FlgE